MKQQNTRGANRYDGLERHVVQFYSGGTFGTLERSSSELIPVWQGHLTWRHQIGKQILDLLVAQYV
jgi:hypothetical protein